MNNYEIFYEVNKKQLFFVQERRDEYTYYSWVISQVWGGHGL